MDCRCLVSTKSIFIFFPELVGHHFGGDSKKIELGRDFGVHWSPDSQSPPNSAFSLMLCIVQQNSEFVCQKQDGTSYKKLKRMHKVQIWLTDANTLDPGTKNPSYVTNFSCFAVKYRSLPNL